MTLTIFIFGGERMEDWLKDAIEKIAGEAEMAIEGCKQIAEKEHIEEAWVLEQFRKEFNKIIK